MTQYIQYDNTGTIRSLTEGGPPPSVIDTSILEVPSDTYITNPTDWYITEAGILAEYTDSQKLIRSSRPFPKSRWSNTVMSWEDLRSLEQVKSAKRKQINTWREYANSSSFSFQGKLIAVDRVSKDDINGITSEVALTNSLPPTFPLAWKALDNTYISVPDVATWKAFVQAMVSQGSANFAHAQELKAAVDAPGATREQIDAITW